MLPTLYEMVQAFDLSQQDTEPAPIPQETPAGLPSTILVGGRQVPVDQVDGRFLLLAIVLELQAMRVELVKIGETLTAIHEEEDEDEDEGG